MHLTGLHLLLTYRCTYSCDHCFVYSSPDREAAMPLAMVLDAIRQAHGLGTVTEIDFEGGEPTLLYPVLLAGVREARRLGMKVGIVTNGWFATTVEDAVEWLRPFAELGGVEISTSDDAYHGREQDKETGPDRVRQAAEQLGLEAGAICIDPPGALEDPHTPGTPILGGGVRFRGRAVEKCLDPSLPRRPWQSFDTCPDEDWVDIGRLHLDPFGHLYPCQGIALGNLKVETLREVVESYNPDHHPIIGPLLRGGPAELVRYHGLPIRGDWVDACHLCYTARQTLRGLHPLELAPGEVYGEE